jgi:phospholipid/cholesterol/gamma-HCH transport system ATP-binding protein
MPEHSMQNSPPTPSPLIRFENVHKRFGSLVVLNGVSVAFAEGKTTVVLGPSGTGKSVLLKHIVGLLSPDSGSVYYRDMRIDHLKDRGMEPIRRKIGFLFQLSALFDSMTVGENVAFPMREHSGLSKSEIRDRVAERLAMVGMENTENKMPGELSGGQRKRVALARAIALNPELVLYDEPTTGLDPIRSDVINELILKLHEELKVSAIVVTHDMTSAFKVGDRLVMLMGGGIIADGTADELRAHSDPRVQRFIAGRADEEDLRALHRI